ncbi:hypothetical protein FOA43_000178 [Brettanomyces nanus]|uniref:Ferric reductase NAD binding domain-containing protein n=1 Tax=Eeniella nana TaxID=13502 RepID=A0A875RXX1_EENNA|nr:uncharacterized protein FOA43_000178 [Brettanomyces nanus]QPG72875.1 hypothetical protein FOA43_000178 [Brettanomyces nanus]
MSPYTILLYQSYYKFRISSVTTVKICQVSTSIAIVEIPNSALKRKSCLPGCHIRIIDFPRNSFFRRLYNGLLIPEQHPYTLSTLPSDDHQKLIVRKGHFLFQGDREYLVTGVFLPFLGFIQQIPNVNPKSLAFRTHVKKCLIVVGGSAISFALPILRVLSYNGAMVKIIWVIRDHEDLKVLDYFKNALVSDDCIDIFITGKYSDSEKMHFREAVKELHRRKEELDKIQGSRMMDFNNRSRSNPKSQGGSSSPRSSLGTENTELDEETNDTNGIGSSLQRAAQKKKSYLSLKNHAPSSGYSYYDEDKFEDVDIELKGHSSEATDRSPLIRNTGAPENYGYLATQGGENDYSSVSGPDMGYYPSANISGISGSASKNDTSSSELYDDLADYWILKGLSCRIDFGRPTLGLYYYSWCTGSSCTGPMFDLQSGEPVCYNELLSQDPPYNVNVNESEDDLFNNANFISHRKARFRDRGGKPNNKILVVAAGPKGLVDKVRLWADDCGFCFHDESFGI